LEALILRPKGRLFVRLFVAKILSGFIGLPPLPVCRSNYEKLSKGTTLGVYYESKNRKMARFDIRVARWFIFKLKIQI
jgi:hypothetical protein